MLEMLERLEIRSEHKVDDAGDLWITVSLVVDDEVISETTEYIDVDDLLMKNDRHKD